MRRMEQNLRIPGPTPIPEEVRQAQSAADDRPPRHRVRGDAGGDHSDGLATLIGTSGDVLLLTGSGSGAMEAAIVNSLSPGDRVLAVIIGGFGDRFADIAQAFGANVDRFEVEWGEAADPAALARPPGRRAAVPGGAAHPQRDIDRRRQPAP